jgi:hypothetical protein
MILDGPLGDFKVHNLDVEVFLRVLRILERIPAIFAGIEFEQGPIRRKEFVTTTKERARDHAEDVVKPVEQLQLPVTLASARRLLEALSNDEKITWENVVTA